MYRQLAIRLSLAIQHWRLAETARLSDSHLSVDLSVCRRVAFPLRGFQAGLFPVASLSAKRPVGGLLSGPGVRSIENRPVGPNVVKNT